MHRRIYDAVLVPLPPSLDDRPAEWDAETRPPETFLCPEPEPDPYPKAVFKPQPVCSHTCNNLAACRYFGDCIIEDLALRGAGGDAT